MAIPKTVPAYDSVIARTEFDRTPGIDGNLSELDLRGAARLKAPAVLRVMRHQSSATPTRLLLNQPGATTQCGAAPGSPQRARMDHYLTPIDNYRDSIACFVLISVPPKLG